jgi:hypothetical protein
VKPGAGALLLLVLSALLAACDDVGERGAGDRNNTAVLGGYGPPAARPNPVPTLSDARGNLIPPPPVPADAQPRMALLDDEEALAVWVSDRRVVASRWIRATGWTQPQPLERIYGESGNAQVVSNGRGVAMAVWHHRVGNIHSLRFSRFDPSGGWSQPDVLAGALPRPGGSAQDAPQLAMDAEGNVTARWTSGFQADEMQVARFTPRTGWSEPASEPVATASRASPAPPAPSSAR